MNSSVTVGGEAAQAEAEPVLVKYPVPHMTVRRTLQLIASDYRRMADHYKFPLTATRAIGITILPALIALILYRISHLAWCKGLGFIAWPMYTLNNAITGADILPRAEIGEACLLGHSAGTMISGRIGRHATLLAKVAIGGGRGMGEDGFRDGLPTIGDNVTIGARSTIMGPIKIGDDTVVGAHSLVIHSVPPRSVVFGLPAKVRRQLTDEEMSRPRGIL